MGKMLYGVVMIVGGLSGTLVLRGTGSSAALVVAGVVVFIIGLAQQSSEQSVARDPTDDAEDWQRYEESKRELGRSQRRAELSRLLADSPEADVQVSALLERTKGHLDPDEQLNVALETARRLSSQTAPARV